MSLRDSYGCCGQTDGRILFVAFTTLLLLTSSHVGQLQSGGKSWIAVTNANEKAAGALDSVSGYFIENRGQVNGLVRYYSKENPAVAFRNDGVMVVLWEGGGGKKEDNIPRRISPGFLTQDATEQPAWRSYAYFVRFEGVRNVTPVGKDELQFKSNFLLGNDSGAWRIDVPNFAVVEYQDLYDGIDLVYHQAQDGIKYEFVVHPGADLGFIRLSYEGVESLRVAEGSLIAFTPLGEVRDSPPHSYQAGGEINCFFIIDDPNSYGFDCADWDRSKDLIIDPMVYSTFLGGGDWDGGRAIAVDPAGNAYIGGVTYSADFPATPGSFDTSFNGGVTDTFVAKLNPAGSSLVYCTYLGGSRFEDEQTITVDQSGSAYVVGSTYSPDFPTTPGAFQATFSNFIDAYVAKLNVAGNGLVYSTFLGGFSADHGTSVALDPAGNAYIAGITGSADFPVTPGAFSTSLKGGGDLFVTKLNSAGNALVYSTYLGGTDYDQMYSIALDLAGDAYVTGITSSADFPVTPGAFDTSYEGGPVSAPYDAFVTELNPVGTGLVYSTFLGGSGTEHGYSVAVDYYGNAYLTGSTNSTDFPVTPGAYDITYNGADDTFLAKLNSAGNALVFSTFLGGTGSDGGGAVALDDTGNAYVTGRTESVDLPTTAGAIEPTYMGNSDAFLIVLTPAGTALIYSSYLGGDNYDSGVSIALDDAGAVYLTGETNSGDFPVSPGAFDTSVNGTDGFVAKLALSVPSPVANLAVYPSDIVLSQIQPYAEGTTVQVNATVHNVGGNYTESTTVRFEDGVPPSPQIGTDQPLPPIPAHGSRNVSVAWTAFPPGNHDICVVADPDNLVAESNETDNIACKSVEVLFSIPLTPGHRLMSFPVAVANDSIDSVLSSVSGCYDYLRWYDPLDSSDHWKSYMPGRSYNDLTRLDNTMGFWINITANCILTPVGPVPASTMIDLHQGWNMVGFPSFNTSYSVGDLKADIGLADVIVEAFDPNAAPYYLQRVGDTQVMIAWEGYWIYVPSDVTWIVGG